MSANIRPLNAMLTLCAVFWVIFIFLFSWRVEFQVSVEDERITRLVNREAEAAFKQVEALRECAAVNKLAMESFTTGTSDTNVFWVQVRQARLAEESFKRSSREEILICNLVKELESK